MATLRNHKPAFPSSPTLSVENPDLALDADLEKQLDESFGQAPMQEGVGSSSRVVKSSELVNGRLPHDDPLNPDSWSTGKKIVSVSPLLLLFRAD